MFSRKLGECWDNLRRKRQSQRFLKQLKNPDRDNIVQSSSSCNDLKSTNHVELKNSFSLPSTNISNYKYKSYITIASSCLANIRPINHHAQSSADIRYP